MTINLLDPSEILRKGFKVPAKFQMHRKYANQVITKNVRLAVTKNCYIPINKKLSFKKKEKVYEIKNHFVKSSIDQLMLRKNVI